MDISIKCLTRYYGSKPALDGIDLILEKGCSGFGAERGGEPR